MEVVLDDRTAIGILKELRRGHSWHYIARRYVLGSAERAQALMRRWKWVRGSADGR